ncbi:translation factor [Fonsecaea erecta]|uniref:Ribosome quality control complex subunit 2 n=1 Tax=Fonsecaea erecta TaxID=1367422 RepID=A0A178Z4Y5_9EURO|nr:translation factor [Fonsecaea erecta]OAP54824.1 translation factor [Fonsecaea erecta]
MKQRFSSLDVKVIANELSNSLTGLRLSNVYDLSSRIFLFKFAKPGKREQLLLDSGFRCHLTSFSRTAATQPSAFVSRLRHYLKSKRVTGVDQVGTDRVIEISFSNGLYRLFLEFFAAGNIVVTDADLNVLALQRQVNEGDADVDIKLGGKYILEPKQNFNGVPPISEERVRNVLQKAVDRSKIAKEVGGKKAKRAKGIDDVAKALSAGFTEFPHHLLEHAFKEAGVDATLKAEDVLGDPQSLRSVMKALEIADQIFKSLGTGQSKGYIIAKQKSPPSREAESSGAQEVMRDSILYDDFHPFRPSQFGNRPGIHILEFDGFNRTVDEFYSSIESQKLESRLTEREELAKRKLQIAKDEHEKRLMGLQQVQELHVRKAQAIEANTHRVEEACAAVNGLIAQGMDWVDIGKLIENEQKRGNVVAQMVKLPLKLEENTVTLLLDEPGFDEGYESDEGDETDEEVDSDEEAEETRVKGLPSMDKRLAIDIDLALSPWANARQYYDQKKSAAVKEKKTVEASAKALKSAEQKIDADLKKGLKQEKAVLRPARKQFWFEKFLYFISSDGYLVIGGKDAQQNELLYRRYLKKGDVYVHADLQGASSVIVKNNPRTPDAPIPPSTLSQAGTLTVCTSSAWDSKALMGAWWVNADQVSKTAPTGEYLTTGGFIIRGHKNQLAPSQLLLGFGVLWLISEESRVNHGKHRIERTESMLPGEAEALANDVRGFAIEEEGISEDTGPDQQQAVPDVEDAADAAVEEKEEDDRGGPFNEVPDQSGQADVDSDDRNSTDASEAEEERSNPLQVNPAQSHKDAKRDDFDAPSIGIEDETKEPPSDEVSHGEESDEDTPASTQPSTRASTPASSSQPMAKSRPAQLARGKRTKLKRAQKKYADQDEEDRALAMQLLGSNRAQERKETAESEKAAREAKAQADKERRRAQHAKAAEKERLRRERLERAAGGSGANGGEGEPDLDEDDELSREQLEQERRELLDIDRLVPLPEPGDELLAAIPVVAPWTALARQKYKIKLQPGNVKKGKVVREVVGFRTSLGARGPKVVDDQNHARERVWRRELDLLKEWRVEEIVGALPVKGCRIVQSGGLGGGLGGGGSGGGKGSGGGGGKGKGKAGGGGKKGR